MSLLRSPPRDMSESQPDLSRLSDDTYINFNQRKRKLPDCHCNIQENLIGFRNEIMDIMKSSLETHTRELKNSFDALRNDLSDFKQEMRVLTQRVSELSDEQTQIKKDICELKSSDTLQSRMIEGIDKQAAELRTSVMELSEQLQVKEQQGRINNIEITGVPVLKRENLMTTLNNIAAKIGFSLQPYDIDYIHRVRRYAHKSNPVGGNSDAHVSPSTPNIVVRFNQRSRKNEMIAAVRARRGLTTVDAGLNGPSTPIFVNDHLTPQNKLLYKQARLTAKDKGYKYIWLSDCKILLRKNDTSKVLLISSESDLLKIK
ncbi:hypothetical protein ABMA28_004190 [Loxostege sticticalis]|uniref:FP protein C-terminal domain-containing protein n=1 Tax=Loxostege sticticalis TaxID=481309 RepID=A0ABD0SUI9_LOXSC